MDRIILFAGIASTSVGVFMFLFQGITYLMHNEWTVYTVYYLVEMGPESLLAQVDANPGLANALSGCPLFLALLVVGMILLFIGSRLSSRYIN